MSDKIKRGKDEIAGNHELMKLNKKKQTIEKPMKMCVWRSTWQKNKTNHKEANPDPDYEGLKWV